MHKAAAVAAAAVVAEAAAAAAAALALVLSQTLTEVKTALHCRIQLIDPGLNDLRETKMVQVGINYGPLRCSDVPLYDSVMDSHAHGLSFSPTLEVVGALMLKRWIAQYGSSKQTD